ncbi:hypothetical protein L615_010600000040 [Nocardioides sp. J9]|uniref:hypothetical protein n=1 Tax=unclassified Nocardioides TaxID=2615069 RepID=UPI0004B64445|nr:MULTISPECIES: hypothetical protein [unclassified Nocardioides]TWH04189.1 hypothetical protein L615_010600000040 [Nocardioides sp. J9]
MTTDFSSRPQERPPTPLELAALAARNRNGGARMSSEAREVKQLECLVCEECTPHEIGPATYGRDGELLVQWWTCQACREGRTVG